jgi:hypothetical protein
VCEAYDCCEALDVCGEDAENVGTYGVCKNGSVAELLTCDAERSLCGFKNDAYVDFSDSIFMDVFEEAESTEEPDVGLENIGFEFTKSCNGAARKGDDIGSCFF